MRITLRTSLPRGPWYQAWLFRSSVLSFSSSSSSFFKTSISFCPPKIWNTQRGRLAVTVGAQTTNQPAKSQTHRASAQFLPFDGWSMHWRPSFCWKTKRSSLFGTSTMAFTFLYIFVCCQGLCPSPWTFFLVACVPPSFLSKFPPSWL